MKKILLMILAVSVIGVAFAQKKNKINYAIKDFNKTAILKNQKLIEKINVPFLPLKPVSSIASTHKALTSIAIATSGNIYGNVDDGVKWLSYDPDLNMISFSHRLGGPWGGTSGQLRVKYSSDFFATKDSVQFVQTGAGLCRYPSNIIYNPTGNTDPLNAVSIVVGPSTDGSGWVNNYFGSQNLGGANFNMQLVPISADSTFFLTDGFSGGSGKYYALAGAQSTVAADASKTNYFKTFNGTYNTSTSMLDWVYNYINIQFRMRTFSNTTATYNADNNIVFADDGMHGYVYTIGKDSTDNPILGAMPIVWETKDGGATWVKDLYQYFDKIPTFQDYLMPTMATRALDPSLWEYRPNISAGSSVDENNTPATVDINGDLHIVALVDGLSSYHPDSLGYGYLNTPLLLFDLKRSSANGCWSAVLVDTLETQVVDAANGGFGTGPDAVGWGHWYRISKTADGSKIFVTWTDTDPTIDTTNIMPEVFGRGFDVVNNLSTLTASFATGDGTSFYMQAANKVAKVGSTYKIPVTYLNIYESGPNPLSAQKHYYMDGVQFDDADFTEPIVFNCPDVNVRNIAQATEKVSEVYPNPVNGVANLSVITKENTNIQVAVVNVLGQTVYQNAKSNAVAGTHSFSFDTKNWSNGVYFYTVTIGNEKITKKLIVE